MRVLHAVFAMLWLWAVPASALVCAVTSWRRGFATATWYWATAFLLMSAIAALETRATRWGMAPRWRPSR